MFRKILSGIDGAMDSIVDKKSENENPYGAALKYVFGETINNAQKLVPFEKDYDKAYALFTKAAMAGHPDAMFWVGHLHKTGLGCSRDMEAFMKWTMASAKAGSGKGQAALAGILEENDRIPDALRWYELAASQGNVEAMREFQRLKERYAEPAISTNERYGEMIFPDNITFGPREYAVKYAYMYSQRGAREIIKALSTNKLKGGDDPQHLFSAMNRNAQIAMVQLIPVHLATYLVYADWAGASNGFLAEMLDGVTETFPSWLPHESMYKEFDAKIRHYGFEIKSAVADRAALIAGEVPSNDRSSDDPELLAQNEAMRSLELALAEEHPDRHPICHIAAFGDALRLAVDQIAELYPVVWARDGLPLPVIDLDGRIHLAGLIADSIRTVFANMTRMPVSYRL